jgi:nondiscriminating aspartyl-tRNA synthetase
MKEKRTILRETSRCIGEEVLVYGWVERRRDHGKLIFFDLRDRSAVVQCVAIPQEHPGLEEQVNDVRSEYIVCVKAFVKERPERSKKDVPGGDVELEIRSLEVLSHPKEDLPVDISQEDMGLQLETLLRYRHLTLRNEKVRSLFRVYASLVETYGNHMRSRDFLEIKSPKLLESATEGGANFFKVQYFEKEAYLAQSPQFYKQAGVGAFERVFEIGTVFRAEPHFTTRHVNEYTGFDAELGFIESFENVMDELERVVWALMGAIREKHQKTLSLYGVKIPEEKEIPRISLKETEKILKKEFNKEIEDGDIDSEGERMIGKYVKERYGSDFVFLTHYPTAIRPFYAMPSKDEKVTESFDLIFRGLEIATGGQRIHDYNQLVASIESHGLNPDDFSSYLDMFRYGMPPHGGWGLGSERIIQQMFGLKSIKEAVLYPRDVRRLSP